MRSKFKEVACGTGMGGTRCGVPGTAPEEVGTAACDGTRECSSGRRFSGLAPLVVMQKPMKDSRTAMRDPGTAVPIRAASA
jgi:hypothetical protein